MPSIGLRPNVVYGVARDQGMSSKNTTAIHAAVAGGRYEIPYTGNYSWLYAGEAAAAFISAASFEPEGAPVFDLNGRCERLEDGLTIVKELAPDADVWSQIFANITRKICKKERKHKNECFS